MPATPALTTQESALIDALFDLHQSARRAQADRMASKARPAKSRPENKRASVGTKRVATPA